MDAYSEWDIVAHIQQHLECGVEGTVSYEEIFLDASRVWNAAIHPHCLQMATENLEIYWNMYIIPYHIANFCQ